MARRVRSPDARHSPDDGQRRFAAEPIDPAAPDAIDGHGLARRPAAERQGETRRGSEAIPRTTRPAKEETRPGERLSLDPGLRAIRALARGHHAPQPSRNRPGGRLPGEAGIERIGPGQDQVLTQQGLRPTTREPVRIVRFVCLSNRHFRSVAGRFDRISGPARPGHQGVVRPVPMDAPTSDQRLEAGAGEFGPGTGPLEDPADSGPGVTRRRGRPETRPADGTRSEHGFDARPERIRHGLGVRLFGPCHCTAHAHRRPGVPRAGPGAHHPAPEGARVARPTGPAPDPSGFGAAGRRLDCHEARRHRRAESPWRRSRAAGS